MSNSPSGSDNTTSQFLIEAELGQAMTHTDRTQHISSGNLVVDLGNSRSFSQPSEANRQIDFVFDGVDTVLDLSLSKISQQSRTIISPDLSAAPQLSVSSISSIMSGTTNTGTGGGHFVRNTARTESEVLAKKVVVPKNKRGIPGSRERGIYYSEARGALDSAFGAARNFVPTSREGETDNQYHNIQEMYVGNLHKLRGVRERCVKYDMVNPLKVPTMIYVATIDPSLQWGGETTKRDMLVHWSQINLADTIAFQRDKNSFK